MIFIAAFGNNNSWIFLAEIGNLLHCRRLKKDFIIKIAPHISVTRAHKYSKQSVWVRRWWTNVSLVPPPGFQGSASLFWPRRPWTGIGWPSRTGSVTMCWLTARELTTGETVRALIYTGQWVEGGRGLINFCYLICLEFFEPWNLVRVSRNQYNFPGPIWYW